MKIHEALLNWYDQNARTLPWRGETDVYRIWLSEIMLQQTRAEAVEKYYARFLERFPNVRALANADEDDVLKLWEGLGYYSRARHLHTAAKTVSASGGTFPKTVEGLQALSGVGPYAARAIASIAYNVCAPALDGNQMRVLSRALGVDRVLKTPFDLEAEAQAEMSAERPGDYNQALMDLGARVCKPKNPLCDECPLALLCQARAEGDPERYPLRPTPVPKREEERAVLLVRAPRGVAIRKRPEKGLLAGLYEFPSLDGFADESALRAMFPTAERICPLPDAKHVFTHKIWRMRGWHIMLRDAVPFENTFYADADAIRARAFPSALRVYREIALDLLETET